MPGDLVGPWCIARTIAKGGFGTVFEVHHQQTGERAALKVMHAHLVASPEMLARFEREVQIIRKLRHLNVVRLLDAGLHTDGRPYLCMEYIDGEDLASLLEKRGRFAPSEAAGILARLCDALAMAHEIGIVHRDLKASNVMITRTMGGELGRVVLLDFGIAKLSDAFAPELTATNQALGTPACMAPEQIRGGLADARTDVYGLGGLLFHLLTCRMPFEDPSSTMMQYLHLHARRPRATSVAVVPARIDEVISRAMAIDPADRYPDVTTLLAAVRAGLRDVTSVTEIADGRATAILVVITDRSNGTALEATFFEAIESVIPIADRFLGTRGFELVFDLGSSALFVARGNVGDVKEVARGLWSALAERPTQDTRVQLGVAVHAEDVTFAGDEIRGETILDPAHWRVPEPVAGVWITTAIDPAARDACRIV